MKDVDRASHSIYQSEQGNREDGLMPRGPNKQIPARNDLTVLGQASHCPRIVHARGQEALAAFQKTQNKRISALFLMIRRFRDTPLPDEAPKHVRIIEQAKARQGNNTHGNNDELEDSETNRKEKNTQLQGKEKDKSIGAPRRRDLEPKRPSKVCKLACRG
jgi:hypothetical protein